MSTDAQGKRVSPPERPTVVFPSDSHTLVKKTSAMGSFGRRKLSDKQAEIGLGTSYDPGEQLTSHPSEVALAERGWVVHFPSLQLWDGREVIREVSSTCLLWFFQLLLLKFLVSAVSPCESPHCHD